MIAVGSVVLIAQRASGSHIRMSRDLRIVRETKTRWVDELGGHWSKADLAAYPMRENRFIVEARGSTMTPCLLCPSPAVADGMCVPCGAKKWAAESWADPVRIKVWVASTPAKDLGPARCDALRDISTPEAARAFLARLDGARKAREAEPFCS